MTRDDEGSITRWIDRLRDGDDVAAQKLWEHYFTRMVELAREKFRAMRRCDAARDEEDAALSAFDSFCAGTARGRFPALADRDGLWRLLAVITARKVYAQARRGLRLKRGGGQVQNAADLGDSDDAVLAEAVGSEPTPEAAAIMAEEYRRLLAALDDPILCKVAVWRMDGETEDGIAAKLGCARRTVARQLALIRSIWRDTGY